MAQHRHLSFSRSSTGSSNATAPNLPGPGRSLGLLFDWLGKQLESKINKRATQLNHGPEAVARDLRRIRRHEEISTLVQYAAPCAILTISQEKKVRKLCKKILNYARSHVLTTQLKALEEITQLAIEDPILRIMLRKLNAGHLVPSFKEPELFVSISKASFSVENVETHKMWSLLTTLLHVTALCDHATTEDFYLRVEDMIAPLMETLSNPASSFLAARYLSRIIKNSISYAGDYLVDLWMGYMGFLSAYPEDIEWSSVIAVCKYNGIT